MIQTVRLQNTKQIRAPFGAAVVIAGLLSLAACASVSQPPNEAMQAAEAAIAHAEQARVRGLRMAGAQLRHVKN